MYRGSKKFDMCSTNLSVSAPNISETNELDKLTSRNQINIVKSKRFYNNGNVHSRNDNNNHFEYLESEVVKGSYTSNNTPEVLILRRSYLQLSPSKTEVTYIARRDGNQRYHHHRAGLAPCRKVKRRAVLKNGDCNVMQVNISERRRRYLQDIFTTLVDAQWRWTLFAFIMSFVLSWLSFACFWWLIAYSHGDFLQENIQNSTWVSCITGIHSFVSCFLFSIETQHSTGYGTRSPTEECPEAIFLMCVQSVAGVMIQAFMVGIVFAKMARPMNRKQTLLFSKNCVVCLRDGQLCLLFRVGDMREKSHLINANLRAYLVRQHVTHEGELLSPFFFNLSIQVDDYDSNMFMIWPMTIVHKINSDSPLFNMSAADLLYEKFEIIVILEGTTESTGQTTQARTSYTSSEVLWGHRFQPMIKYNKQLLVYEVDYAVFHNTYQVDTPLCSANHLHNYISAEVNPIINNNNYHSSS